MTNAALPARRIAPHPIRRSAFRPSSGLDARTVADLVGKPYATLMSELSQQPGHKLGAELLLPLMDVCESDLPLVFLARQRGGAFVPLRLPDDGPVQLVTGLSVSIREFGEFAVAAAEQIADGKITAEELQEMRRLSHEAVEAIMQLVALAGEVHDRQLSPE